MAQSTIIANGIVLTCDAVNRCGWFNIAVSEGRILALSENLDLLMREYPDAAMIDAREKLIVPGFVNAHHHGVSFLLQEVTRGLHFNLWRNDAVVSQATAKFLHRSSAEDVRKSYGAVYAAHLKSGTTCVGEFTPPIEEESFANMLEGMKSSGISSVVTLQNWDQIRKAKSTHMSPLRCAVSLGEPGDFTVYSFEHLTKAAKEMKVPLVAHIAETREDVDVVRRNFQRDSLTLLNAFNTLRTNTILVHANHATEEEVQMIKNVGGTVVVCPRSTAVKQTGYPSLRLLAKHSVRLCLGTDWGTTDMIEEMRFLNQLPLIIAGLRPFSAREVLRMATINGAYALGVSNEVGSIEAGKRADMVFFRYADIRLPVVQATTSGDDWARLLVENISTSDLTEVMVNGELKLSDGELCCLSEEKIAKDLETLYQKYFQHSASAIPHNPSTQVQAEAKTNVLSFLPDRSQDEDGFETGFPATPKSATILDISDRSVESNPTTNPQHPSREPIKPELSKNTRRVFGDDEDLG